MGRSVWWRGVRNDGLTGLVESAVFPLYAHHTIRATPLLLAVSSSSRPSAYRHREAAGCTVTELPGTCRPGCRSSTVTRWPSLAKPVAAVRPAGPAPTMTMEKPVDGSAVLGSCILVVSGGHPQSA